MRRPVWLELRATRSPKKFTVGSAIPDAMAYIAITRPIACFRRPTKDNPIESSGQPKQVIVYRARWLCTADRQPIRNGAVAVNAQEILSVGASADVLKRFPEPQSHLVDLGDGAIIPGLVNAHTHLEFSDLKSPLGQPGINFTDWIRLIVAQRTQSNREFDSNSMVTKKAAAIADGMEQSFESGVWTIGEISTLPFLPGDLASRRHMLLICFLEQLGQDESLLDQKQNELATFFANQSQTDAGNVMYGSSPHAPYSVSQRLLRQMCRQSTSAGRPVAMHLAETLVERELLEHRTGDFVQLLKDFGAWNAASFENGLSINDTIKVLATAPRSLIVHGNYLSDAEMETISANSSRMSIAYCPRTHHFFGHSDYPLEPLLRRGINVCLGTDSRASNPDLDLFKDAKHVARSFSQLDPAILLKMATLNGAIALDAGQASGSLSAGKRPALNFVTHPNSGLEESPLDWMFDIESNCSPLSPDSRIDSTSQ